MCSFGHARCKPIIFCKSYYSWNKALKFQDHKETLGEHIQSLQQTEFDVEIEMENSLSNGYKNQPDNIIGFIAEYKSVPKLDSEGCLILKRRYEK